MTELSAVVHAHCVLARCCRCRIFSNIKSNVPRDILNVFLNLEAEYVEETVFHQPMLRFNLRHDRFTDLAIAKFALFPRRTSKMRDSPINWRRLFAARVKSKEKSVCLRALQRFIGCKINPRLLSAILQHSRRLLS